MYKESNATVGEVVISIPEAAGIFKETGIDYCCGGNRKLADVIRELGLMRKIYIPGLKKQKVTAKIDIRMWEATLVI